jgi:hypothetical protein
MKLDNVLTYCLPDSRVTFHSYDASESKARLLIIKDAVLESGYAVLQKVSFISLPIIFEVAGMETELIADIKPENYPKQILSQDSFENTDILFTFHTPNDEKFYVVAQSLQYIVIDDSRND